MNIIARSAEVRDHRYGASRKSLDDYSSTELAHRWKHKHIRGSQLAEDLGMTKPAAERDSFLDPKRSRELSKAVPLRAVTDHGEAGQIASQEGSRCSQCEITSFVRNKRANKNQFQLTGAVRTTQVTREYRAAKPVLRDIENFVPIYP